MEETKETTLLEWSSPEFQSYSRNLKYYLVMGAGLLGVIGYSVYMRDWYAIVIFLILAGFIYWNQQKTPSEKKYKVTQLGLYADEKLYLYNEIYSYYLTINDHYRALNIVFTKKYLPELTIIINSEIDPVELKTKLSAYIPEDTNRTEAMVDKLARLFRL